MASDLPEMRHDSSLGMARVLTQYMDCPHAVLTRIREDFDRPPTLSTIRRLRAEHLAPRPQPAEAPFKAYEGYRPDEVSRNAILANERFLDALKWERHNSAALRSTFLERPELVNARWDRTVADAKRDVAA